MNTQKHIFLRFALLEFSVVLAYFSVDMTEYFTVFAFSSLVFFIFFMATFVFKGKDTEENNFSGVPLI